MSGKIVEARPRLDHALLAGLVHLFDASHETLVDERTLLR
jgi:hypothetical protein